MPEATLKAVLEEINAMEGRVTIEINACTKEISANRLALAETAGELKGKIAVVQQKVKDHVAWEELKYATEAEKHKALDKKVDDIEEKVSKLNVDTAVNKTKVGLLSILGGSGAFGALHAVKSLFGITPPQ